MSKITPTLIKELREKTGAGMLDCKKALVEFDADLTKAVKMLREKGLAKATKREGRATKEGKVVSYIHGPGRIGVLLELNCETDFVAKNEDFESLGRDICMQIAATNPLAVNIEDLTEEDIENEKSVFRAQLKKQGKPDNIIDKIIDGKIKKYYSESVLMQQTYIKDEDVKIEEYLKSKIAAFGENVTIGRFSRFQIGG